MADGVTAGVDGTPESAAAARWAAGEALERKSVLHLVHVVTGTGTHGQALSGDDAVRQHGERMVREVTAEVATYFPKLTVDSAVRTGKPDKVLTELSHTSELLVIGSRGLSTLHGFLVGSVALPTVAHTRCPLVLVRGRQTTRSHATFGTYDPAEGKTPGAPPRSVVVGVDTLHPCEELLAFAFETAQRKAAPLKVLHGWEPPAQYGSWPVPLSAGTLDAYVSERATHLAAMIQPWREKYPHVTVDARAVLEQPAYLLAKEAHNASLTVVGRRLRSSDFGGHAGPVAHAVMHHVRTPVAIVPHA